MLRKIVNALILVPLALIFVVFAVANRHFVTVSFDPFGVADPGLSLSLPLFVVLIVTAILGIVAGSAATWFRHRHWRRAARRFEAEAGELRARLADWNRAPPAEAPRRLPPAA